MRNYCKKYVITYTGCGIDGNLRKWYNHIIINMEVYSMSQVTKRALEQSLKNLLLKKPLTKITINDIA